MDNSRGNSDNPKHNICRAKTMATMANDSLNVTMWNTIWQDIRTGKSINPETIDKYTFVHEEKIYEHIGNGQFAEITYIYVKHK